MKPFYIYCISILFPIILFFSIGEYLVRQVPNPYKYKEYWMEKHQKEVETLIMGGSQTFYGVKPNLLEGKAFNLANTSQGLEYDYFILNRFSCPYLKTIIIPISYLTMFQGPLEEGIEWYRAIFYKIYMDYPEHSSFSRYNFEFTNQKIFLGKLEKYYKGLAGLTYNKGYDEWGWGNEYLLSKKKYNIWNDGTEAETAVKRHTPKDWNRALKRAEINTKRLRDIANTCKEKQITLILITTPCWHSYVELLDKRQLNKTYELIKQIQKDYDVVYFDYLKDKRFEANDFFDSNHLSEIGAEKFTIILNNDINKAKTHLGKKNK